MLPYSEKFCFGWISHGKMKYLNPCTRKKRGNGSQWFTCQRCCIYGQRGSGRSEHQHVRQLRAGKSSFYGYLCALPALMLWQGFICVCSAAPLLLPGLKTTFVPSAAEGRSWCSCMGRGPHGCSLCCGYCRQNLQNYFAGIFWIRKCFCGEPNLFSGQIIISQVVSPWDPGSQTCPVAWPLQGMQVRCCSLNQAQTSPTNSIVWGRMKGVPCGTPLSQSPGDAARKKGRFHPYLGIPTPNQGTKSSLKLCSQRRNHLIHTKISLKVGLEEVCPSMDSNFTALRGQQTEEEGLEETQRWSKIWSK